MVTRLVIAKELYLYDYPFSFFTYIFTSQFNNDRSLSQETLTKDLNKVLRTLRYKNLTTDSSSINELWVDPSDFEFVSAKLWELCEYIETVFKDTNLIFMSARDVKFK